MMAAIYARQSTEEHVADEQKSAARGPSPPTQCARRCITATLSVVFLACGSAQGMAVNRQQYGARWPFTMDAGTLECQRESQRSDRLLVTLDTGNGISYGLNGAARS